MQGGIMKSACLLIIALCIVPRAAVSQTEEQPRDLLECIEQIKAWNMSESALMSLRHISGIRLGGAVLSFRKDEQSGAYFPSYSGTQCYSPDRDPEEVRIERERMQYMVDREITRLKPLADSDGSGFVSTSEGAQFRELLEFGYKAARVISAEGRDIERVCRGLQMNAETFRDTLAKYREIRRRAKGLGIEDLPEVAFD
jgi:hypothetical protein